MNRSANHILRYTLLPGFIPRLKELVGTGFSFLAASLAVVYANVRILPKNHVYLQPQNYGQFGVRHVIAEAGRNIKFSKENIDQILIYLLTLSGFVMLFIQVALLCASLFSMPAFAATWSDRFLNTTHGPEQDIAFFVLDSVFGVMRNSGASGGASFFGSCVGVTGVDCTNVNGEIVNVPSTFPWPAHTAFHSLLHFYTIGVWYVAVLVILYFVMAIVGETVTSGTPFGQRFNKAWALPRLLVFFALVAPITTSDNNAGVSVGQLITLSIAKYGSNFATNSWDLFTSHGVEAMTQGKNMVAIPEPPSFGEYAQFIHIMHMCRFAERIMYNKDIQPFFVRAPSSNTDSVTNHEGDSMGYDELGTAEMSATARQSNFLHLKDTATTVRSLRQMVAWSRYKDVILRFGHYNPPASVLTVSSQIVPSAQWKPAFVNPPGSYDNELGHVEPTCGELVFRPNSLDNFVLTETQTADGSSYITDGIQENYFSILNALLISSSLADQITAYCMVKSIVPYGIDPECAEQDLTSYAASSFTQNTHWLTVESADQLNRFVEGMMSEYITGESMTAGSYSYDPDFDVVKMLATESVETGSQMDTNLLYDPQVQNRGWVGAALWYNRIATLNGKVVGAMRDIPVVSKYPMVMEKIASEHRLNDANYSHKDRFNPKLENGKLASLPRAGDQYMAAAYYNSYRIWADSQVGQSVNARSEGNLVTDMINMSMGGGGLFDMLKNQNTHPMAMLSSLGKTMVDTSVSTFFVGLAGQTVEQLFSNAGFVTKFAEAVSGFAFKFAMIGMMLGFSLYYVFPLLPFVYFFFAFGAWVKSVMEAVLAMPLWALAHVRIDGQGLPGNMATNGYFLLFEIFLRPFLILVGFIGCVSLYSALIGGLNMVYNDVVSNISGQNLNNVAYWSDMTASSGRFPELSTITKGLDTMRQPLDQFFYTILYVIMVYMIGMSCFKMIDMVPRSILRWIGATVSTFQERGDEGAQRLAATMYRSTKMTNLQLEGMLSRMRGGKDNSADMAIQQNLLR